MGGSAPTPSLLVSSSSPPLLPALSHFSLRLLLPLPSLFSPPRPLWSLPPAPPFSPLLCSAYSLLLRLFVVFVIVSSSSRCPGGGGLSVAPLARLRASTTAKIPLLSAWPPSHFRSPSSVPRLRSPRFRSPSSVPRLPSACLSILVATGEAWAPRPPLPPASLARPGALGVGGYSSPLPSGWRPRLAAPLLGVPKRFWGAHPGARQSAGWGASSPRGLRWAGVRGGACALGPRGPRGLRAGGGRLP